MQYYCKNQERRLRVINSPLGPGLNAMNGVDYLEVVSFDQKTLEIHFLRPLPGQAGGVPALPPLTKDNIKIEGGTRVKNIKAASVVAGYWEDVTTPLWADATSYAVGDVAVKSSVVYRCLVAHTSSGVFANDLAAGYWVVVDAWAATTSYAVGDIVVESSVVYRCLVAHTSSGVFANDLAAASKILTVQVDNAGDFSMYTLRIVVSPTDTEPPAGFDAQLAFVEFSFKAGCPSDFDCKTEDICRDEAPEEPRIDYLAKDYASFRRLMLDRLSLLSPDWTERNAADLQVALVELLAYTGDYLSYYQDAVATEAYLFKARKRVSARRHARLLDYHVHNGCNARTWVTVEVESSSDGASLPVRTVLLTRGNGNEVSVHPNDIEEKLQEKGVVVFESIEKIILHHSQNKIDFYTWDDTNCCLPRGATSATLYSKTQQDLFLQGGQVLVLEEVLGPTTGFSADADPNHRHAVRLTSVGKKLDILHGIEVWDIQWHEEDALPFPLCISTTVQGILVEGVSVARGNIVLADHGRTVEVETLIPEAASDDDLYRPILPDVDITVTSPRQAGVPAARVLKQDPHQAIPAIELTDGSDVWNAKRDLLASDRFATEFVAEIESDLNVHIRFGDDTLGKKPGKGFRPTAKYRIGNGVEGNIGADAIGRMVWSQAGILKVRNPLPAQGGKKPETIEEVRQFAPEAFRTQERAVTEADYVAKTELHPQVQKALANFRWTGSWHTVFLTIDRKSGLELDDKFKQEIYAHLEKYRMAGYDLEVRPPVLVPLELALNICVKPGIFRSNVQERLLEEFSRFDLPNGAKGFFHPDEFTFGQPVYLSAIYQRAMAVEGVASVEIKTFKRQNRSANQEIANGVLMPKESEIIQLDNDPNFPENGKIAFIMYGGL